MTKKLKLFFAVILLVSANIFAEDQKPFNPDIDVLPSITQKEFELLEQNPDIDFVYMPDVIRDLINDKKDSEKIDVNVVPRSLLLPELDKKIDQIKNDDSTLTVLRSYKKVVESGEAIITADEISEQDLDVKRNWKGKNKTLCSLRVKNDLRVCGTICADCIKLGAFRISSNGLTFGTSTLTFDPANNRLIFSGDVQVNNVFANGNVKFCNNTLNAVGNSAASCLNIIRGTVDTSGTIIAGEGFTAAGTGPIDIAFTTSYISRPSIVASYEDADTVSSPTNNTVWVQNVTNSTFQLIGDGGTFPTGARINFVAIGPK